MPAVGRHFTTLGFLFVLILGLGQITACNSNNGQPTVSPELRTRLLVQPPDGPLPVNRAVNVRARIEDARYKVSHAELYAVQLPTGESNVLIRSDAAPFDQTSFTSSQVFVPSQRGHYVIKVVGYNKRGQAAESDYLGFDVE